MNILSRDTLHRGGFAGIKETRLVKDAKIGGKLDTWDGLGNFVYFADARYVPYGESGMHPHLEVDVITIMVEGRLTHEGSMEHGQSMVANQAQVQRAGGEGFNHNEINPDESHTVFYTGLVYNNYQVSRTGETLVYVVNGEAIINGQLAKDGDLVRAQDIDLKVISDDAHLTLIGLEGY
jgi:redox-sensitive bicupin YhaK (pirin superfamily)